MATYTTVGIVNHALLLCGASPITALTDDTANARAMNAIYENARKSVLTECRWTFSLTRTTLVTVATTTIQWLRAEEAYVYNRPTDILRIWEMSDIEAIWREEGAYIISDTITLGTLATRDHAEVGLWRHKFVDAFMDKLCSDVSFMILNDAKKGQLFLEKYEKITLPKAMAEDSQTGTHQEVIDNEWLKSKYGGVGNPARSYS